MEVPIKPKHGYCINCDNRHGCKSQTPPCIAAMMENNVIGVSGKQYLVEKNMAHKCRDCSFFRSCWSMEEYNQLPLFPV
ncbi:MAG TPA: hypothetical protein PLX02_11290 [Syntrophorhabdaceae bacterium]|nr:hypothetical protein [Syntrophorhabdaceae bacterium]HQM82195.1 hypothetical protein [Syntrophorhabdaceae bacterium]